jgi:hypothetical protein
MAIYSSIEITTGRVGYVKIGNGHPLIMINRYAATLYNWDSRFIDELAKHFTLKL